jgi:uncharacterized protein (DUF952 family)
MESEPGSSFLSEHDLFRKPVPTPDQVRGKLFRDHARRRARVTTIYKICEQALWRGAESDGLFLGTAVDQRDGFIHFSSAAQVAATAAKHFAQKSDLMLVAVDAGSLGVALKWERSRGGELFPHLYAALPLSAVRWARPLPDEVDGGPVIVELEP